MRYYSSCLEHPPSGWKQSVSEKWSDDYSSYNNSSCLEFHGKVSDDSAIVFEKKRKRKKSNNNKWKKSWENTKYQPRYLYIQMQLCMEYSLKDWLVLHKKRAYNQVVDFFLQILNAVEYIHHSGLMHRDLKYFLFSG